MNSVLVGAKYHHLLTKRGGCESNKALWGEKHNIAIFGGKKSTNHQI
jgi:hypothetical protein